MPRAMNGKQRDSASGEKEGGVSLLVAETSAAARFVQFTRLNMLGGSARAQLMNLIQEAADAAAKSESMETEEALQGGWAPPPEAPPAQMRALKDPPAELPPTSAPMR